MGAIQGELIGCTVESESVFGDSTLPDPIRLGDFQHRHLALMKIHRTVVGQNATAGIIRPTRHAFSRWTARPIQWPGTIKRQRLTYEQYRHSYFQTTSPLHARAKTITLPWLSHADAVLDPIYSDARVLREDLEEKEPINTAALTTLPLLTH